MEIEATIKEETADANPWSVNDASVFLKYCCPECDYNIDSLKVFSHHALENHVKSLTLFEKTSNGNEPNEPNDKDEIKRKYHEEVKVETELFDPHDYVSAQGNLLQGIDNKSVRR